MLSPGGRIFEVRKPFAANPEEADVRWLSKIPAMAHEGLRFDAAGSLYSVDESNTGCIYKYTPKVKNDLSVGQTFVLKVTSYTGNPAFNYDNLTSSPRIGAATWVPITDINGNKTTSADPFVYVTSTGRR